MNRFIQFCKMCLFGAVFLWGSVNAHGWSNGFEDGQGGLAREPAFRLWDMVEGTGLFLSMDGDTPWHDDSFWRASREVAMEKMGWDNRAFTGLDLGTDTLVGAKGSETELEALYRRYFILETMRGAQDRTTGVPWDFAAMMAKDQGQLGEDYALSSESTRPEHSTTLMLAGVGLICLYGLGRRWFKD